jgi:hypothetical protein
MRRWPLHAVFAAILLGSLAAKCENTDTLAKSGGFEPAVIRVARAHGLAFRDYAPIGDTDTRALVFEAPGCAGPVLAVLLLVTFDIEPIARSARGPGYVLRYVYIDRSWDKADPLAVITQRVKYAALQVFGLSGYVPSPDLLLLESPAECHLATEIDWRMAWSRNYLAAAETTSR